MILDDAMRGSLFRQLARLESAGIARDQAIRMVNLNDKAAQKKLGRLAGAVKSGRSLSEAALRLGLISEGESAALAASEASGKTTVVLTRSADLLEQRASRIQKFKSRLVLPVVMIVLAHFIAPVPALIAGSIDLFDYLWSSVGGLLRLGLVVFALIKLPDWLTHGFLKPLGLAYWVYRLQMGAPVFGPLFVRSQVNRFCDSLSLLLEAGLPAAQALPHAVSVIENPLLRDQFAFASPALARGDALADALANVTEIDRSIIQVVRSGEASGLVVESLMRHTAVETEQLAVQADMVAEWLPRLVYFLVIAWLASGILAGSGISTMT